ncbi:hypothetical protein QFC24_005737 [Naganishia onofrii]|uniref:Uncharacterized protein n=1 Tax=Naganishia onofrii TaxID=1851511 RepID=A0ACC2X752_9TREE|nr:hypothetical protein QFC24_005737 [Naganishia onofrii]
MYDKAETVKIRPTEERDLQAIAEILYERYRPCKWWQVINFEDYEGLPDLGDTPGEKTAELDKIDSSGFKDELVAKYGKVLWISEFAVHLDYAGRGLADLMMQYIVDEAKKAKMNVALAAAPDEIDWHKEWNFKEMHPARMLMDDTVLATNQMLLELLPSTA